MVIITLITLFVAALLGVGACTATAPAAIPIPSRTSHNTILEVAWTVMPVLILVIIAIPVVPARVLRGPDRRRRI